MVDRFIDKTGNRYGQVTVLRPLRKDGSFFWECVCDCGKSTIVRTQNLKLTQSCGCMRPVRVSEAKRTHGLSGSRTYRVWHNMRQRCKLPSNKNYKNYGGRGITYDPRWDSFANFLADMGEAPTRLDLDRKDNNGNYEAANCRWATRIEQENNKRNNVVVEFRGERFTVAQLARATGLTYSQLSNRISSGWSIERAATTGRLRSHIHG